MKAVKKVMIALPLVMFMLTGCTIKKPAEVSEEDSIVEVSSEESVASEETTISEETSSEEVSVETSTEEESSEEESISEESSEEPAVVYTVQGVMEDICTGIFGSAVLDDNYWSDGQGGFYTGVGFGSYGEEYLALAVNTVIGMLPDYCVEVEATHTGTWEDGSNGAFASFATDDGTISVELGSYVYNSKLYAQINVF